MIRDYTHGRTVFMPSHVFHLKKFIFLITPVASGPTSDGVLNDVSGTVQEVRGFCQGMALWPFRTSITALAHPILLRRDWLSYRLISPLGFGSVPQLLLQRPAAATTDGRGDDHRGSTNHIILSALRTAPRTLLLPRSFPTFRVS